MFGWERGKQHVGVWVFSSWATQKVFFQKWGGDKAKIGLTKMVFFFGLLVAFFFSLSTCTYIIFLIKKKKVVTFLCAHTQFFW